jgi:GTP-binding protein
MVIKNATFITSAASPNQFIRSDKPIIAVVGKSNVGKSSLINMLANQKKLAKTSDTPGRTRLVNYFDFGEFILADLPGYGFAKVSKQEKITWAKTMEDFFNKTEVAHCLSLVDIRHKPTEDDYDMINYLHNALIPFTVVATKSDKLGKSMVKPALKKVADYLSMGMVDIIGVSSETGYGKDTLLAKLQKVIDLFNEKPMEENIETQD